MKRSITFAARVLLAAGLVASAGSTALAEGSQVGRAPWYSLIGTWTSVVTHVDCVNGQPTNPPPFEALDSFHLGGTYGQFGSVFGNRRSDGFGTWRRTGRDTFEASLVFFKFDDATGAIPVASIKLERQIRLTGPNTLSSVNRSTITLLATGQVVQRACSLDAAKRI
jgi:hypothetical protein